MNTTEGVIFRYYKYDISAVDILWRGIYRRSHPQNTRNDGETFQPLSWQQASDMLGVEV